jgi:hypothetical protein
MPTRQEQLYKRLTEEGDKVLAMFEALSPERRKCPVYVEGTLWTVKDILAHQVSTERSIRMLLSDILAGGQGVSKDFSIDRFNVSEVARMSAMPWEELTEAFRIARADTAALALSLAEEQLESRGRHPFLGITSVGDILQLLYRHNMMHIRDIRRAFDGRQLDVTVTGS